MKNSTHIPKHLIHKALKSGPIGLSMLLAIIGGSAHAANSQYFTTSVVNGGTYSWDSATSWSVSGGTSTGPFASAYTPGDFARFYGGGTAAYTVTVNAAESMAGMYYNQTGTLNINDAGSGTGSLSVVANTSQASQNGFSWLTQGFLTAGGTLNINAPITGTGGVEQEAGGGTFALYGVNTYTGGTLVTSSGTFFAYNNNSSFGALSSQIGFDGTTFAIMENTGPTSVNIANPVQIIGTTGINFIGNGATWSGSFAMGANTVNLRNNGVATTLNLAGAMSGTGPVTFSGANAGNITLSGANNYTGATTLGVTGDTSITLQLGVANAIASSSKLTLAGGTLNLGGFNQAMGSTPLAMTATSTIDFGAGASASSFANSASQTWTGTLNIINWTTGVDSLEFGTSPSALTTAQLADIDINGVAGEAALDPNGFLIVTPEPSTLALGVAGGLGVLWTLRRRTA